ncbi:DNA adenine methylase [Propionimicrobium lymphophilum]|uniref:DNA adenine methylase n=2 Tax=Propionimicrobium lymphophilum TaxID=33012 RepID=UPI003EC5CA6B
MKFLSPLRYPGGKAKLAPFFARTIAAQPVKISSYAEPFAGGAGAGLRLLEDGAIDRLYINDLNPGIAAFWRACLRKTKDFCRLIYSTPVDVKEWTRQKEIYDQASADDLALGFATFYLNRTNRSGILGARPIGGLEQTGKWKIDARFNKADLCHRIQYISRWSSKIIVSQLDAEVFLDSISPVKGVLVYVDPPYIKQGDELYFSIFSKDKHKSLAKKLNQADYRWILTYDTDNAIPNDLYKNFRCAHYGISHTAQVQHVGKELVVFSDNLFVPDFQITKTSTGVLLER